MIKFVAPIIAVSIVVLGFAGCRVQDRPAPNIAPKAGPDVAARKSKLFSDETVNFELPKPDAPPLHVERDEFSGTMSVSLRADVAPIEGVPPTLVYLRAGKKDEVEVVGLSAVFFFRGWAFLDSAASGGEKIELISRDRQVAGGGKVREEVGIALSTEKHDDLRQDGLRIKFYGKQGSSAFEVPADAFRTFLDGVEEHL